MKKTVLLELKQPTLQQCYHIQIDSCVTFQQLHQIILILFQWQDDQPYQFQHDTQTIPWNDRMIYETVKTTVSHGDALRYRHGDAKSQQEVYLHTEYSSASMARHIELLDHPWNAFQELEIYKALDAIFVPEGRVSQGEFASLLERLRIQLLQVKTIAPCLLLFEHYGEEIPVYLDILDNGIELMVFPDQHCFIRSIVNASSTDPDLLFTYSYTFDFLYESLKESELPLFASHTLCYKNTPGKLPCAFDDMEYYYAFTLLNKLHQLLTKTKHLPSFGDHQMMRIRANGDFCICENDLKEVSAPLMLTSEDLHHMAQLPHTNEHYHMFLQAMPRPDSKYTHQLDIKLCAANPYFRKEHEVDISSMETLSEDIYIFLKQLFRERGLAESIRLSSRNLYVLISSICTDLGIQCSLHGQQVPCGNELLDMICAALDLTPEELFHVEQAEPQITKMWS